MRRFVLFLLVILAVFSGASFAKTTRYVPPQVMEVCLTGGCKYTSPTAALAAITDSSASKRYEVVIGPGDYQGQFAMKAYTALRGTSLTGTRLVGDGTTNCCTVEIPGDIEGVSVSNMTIGGRAPIGGSSTSTVVTTAYIDSAIVGITDGSEYTLKTEDGIVDSAGSLRTWVMTNTRVYSIFDTIFIGSHATFYGSGNQYFLTDGGANNTITIYRVTAGAQFFDQAPQIYVNSASTSGAAYVILSNHLTGANSRPVIYQILNARIQMVFSNASRNAISYIASLQSSLAFAAGGNFIDLSGSQASIVTADSSSSVVGINVTNDADHAGWKIHWRGGSFSRTGGGATNYDVNTADNNAGFEINLSGLVHSGTYNGAGTSKILAADTRLGAFTSRLLGRVADLVAQTGTQNEIALDTGGATKEICIFDAGEWACSAVTDATGPAD